MTFWAHISNLTNKTLTDPAGGEVKQILSSLHKSTMIDFFTENTFDILQSILVYLRRELKVPEYSLVFEEDSEGLSK